MPGAGPRRRLARGGRHLQASPEWCKLVALLVSVLTGGMSLWVLFVVRDGRRRLPVRQQARWIEPWGISWHLGVDGISLFLVVLTGILFPLVIARRRPAPRPQALPVVDAAARSRDDGQLPQPRPVPVLRVLRDRARADVLPHRRLGLRRRVYAATKFFLYTMVGSAFMLVGIIATAVLAKANGAVHVTFDLVEIAEKADSPPAPGAGCSSRSPSRSR
jgi:NADH-quinone oxidoreductase subunit M